MIKKIKAIIKYIYHKIYNSFIAHIKIQNIIFFEGAPDFQDSSRYIYEEMIRRKWNYRYAMYWAVDRPEDFREYRVDNTYFVKKGSKKWETISQRSRILLSCNYPFYKTILRNDQLYIHLGHGCAFKSCGSLIFAPKSTTYVNILSMYNADIEAKINNVPIEKIIALGNARNDVFYIKKDIDVHKLFPDSDFKKLIMWLPTFRQNISKTRIYSSIKIPIIHTINEAKTVNEIAKAEKVLLVIKPHFNQDLSEIEIYDFSNLKIIKDKYLFDRNLSLYELLSQSDALITDYSSVLQDYLNANKPIGLCWEDFDEFNEKEGFDIDIQPIRESGEIINTIKDMEHFIKNISYGFDEKKMNRQKLNILVNPYQDGKATERMINFIESWLSKRKLL